MDKIFFAWQSKYPEINRKVIEKALERAARRVKSDPEILIEPKVDDATAGTAGAVNIHNQIFKKIGQDTVFVGDLSTVNQGSVESLPNPNVMVELGYAMGVWGLDEDKLHYLLVVNTFFGKVESLPFDIRQLSTVTYCLAQNATEEEIKKQTEVLTDKLTGQLRSIYSQCESASVQSSIKLAVIALGKPNKTERKEAVETLINMAQGSPGAYKALLEALNHHISDIRNESALKLANNFGEAKATSVLVDLLDFPDLQVRSEAVTGLIKIGSNVVEVLQPKLTQGSLETQRLAVYVLGEVRSQKAGEYLLELLNNQHNSMLKGSIFGAFGKLKYFNAVDVLIENLGNLDGVQHEAVNALVQVGTISVPKLCKVLLSQEGNPAIPFAIDALGKIADNRAICYLLHMRMKTYTSVDYNASGMAGGALQNIGYNIRLRSKSEVVGSLKTDDDMLYPSTREEAISSLIMGLDLWELDILIAIVKALELIGTAYAAEGLVKALKNNDLIVQTFAVRALGKVGGVKAQDALITIINDTNRSDLTKEAAKALETLSKR